MERLFVLEPAEKDAAPLKRALLTAIPPSYLLIMIISWKKHKLRQYMLTLMLLS